MSSSADQLQAFTDTSVLFNYALDVDAQRADELLIQHECMVVASETVRREFESVRDRRQSIHDDLLPYAKNDEIEEYEPNVDDLKPNDRRYVHEFRRTLREMDPLEAARRVQERNRQLKQAYRELFKFDEPLVTVLSVASRDAQLLGTMSGIVENDDDARILCDAVEWTRSDGSGIFITSDSGDMLGNNESHNGEDEQASDNGLSETFEGFLSGDTRSRPDQINDAISQRYGSGCCLDIFSIDSFLTQY